MRKSKRNVHRLIGVLLAILFLSSCGVSGDPPPLTAANMADFTGATAFDLSDLSWYLDEQQMVAVEGALRDKLAARGIPPDRAVLQFRNPAKDAVKVPFGNSQDENLADVNISRLAGYIAQQIAAACGADMPAGASAGPPTATEASAATGPPATTTVPLVTATIPPAATTAPPAITTTIPPTIPPATTAAVTSTATGAAVKAAATTRITATTTAAALPAATRMLPVSPTNPPSALVVGKNLSRADIAGSGSAFLELNERNPKKVEVTVGGATLLVARAPYNGESVVTYHIYNQETDVMYKYISTVTRIACENTAFELASTPRGSAPSRDRYDRVLAYKFTFFHTATVKDQATYQGATYTAPPGCKFYAGNLFVYDARDNKVVFADENSFT